jgi:hypothetical protein
MAKKRAKKRKLTRTEINRYRSRQLGDLQKPFPMWLAAGVALGAALVAFAVSRTAEA